jgi:hypothetical protein
MNGLFSGTLKIDFDRSTVRGATPSKETSAWTQRVLREVPRHDAVTTDGWTA